jgi:hypothetical protein
LTFKGCGRKDKGLHRGGEDHIEVFNLSLPADDYLVTLRNYETFFANNMRPALLEGGHKLLKAYCSRVRVSRPTWSPQDQTINISSIIGSAT